MASDNDFFIIRKFDKLNARVILMMQDRISCLEEKLEKIDQECRTMVEGKGDNGTLRHDSMDNGRQAILDELVYRLDKYSKAYHSVERPKTNDMADKFVLRHSELKARPKPLKYQIENVDTWFYNNEDAIHKAETEFITKKEDLMAVVPKSQVPLRKFVGSFEWIKKMNLFREKRVRYKEQVPYLRLIQLTFLP